MSFTKIPNILFDVHLPNLSESELKILLIIYRQTVGWKNPYTKKRKERDRISISQFIQKTGLAKRTISLAIQSLIDCRLIQVTDFHNFTLKKPIQRKGKSYLYYEVASR